MGGEEELLGEIARRPAEDEPRLAWARWLEGKDAADARARFVRGQIVVARTSARECFSDYVVTEAAIAAEETRVAEWRAHDEHVRRSAPAEVERWRGALGVSECALRRG